MSWLSGIDARLRELVRRDSEERLDDEIEFHLEMETRRLVQEGLDPAEARRRALLAFGGVQTVREEIRAGRLFSWVDDALRDAKQALRSLGRERGFAASAVLTIALGIGANTAIFGVVDALFLRAPEGVAAPSQVTRLYIARDEGDVQTGPYGGPGSYVDYRAIRDGVRAFEQTAAFLSARQVDLDRGPAATRVAASVVTHTYLPMLGVRTGAGRLFDASEDSIEGANPVVLVSHDFATRRFGSPGQAIDRTLLLNGQRTVIVGVLERGFAGIEPEPIDVWVPMAMAMPLGIVGLAGWREQSGMIMVNTIGRLAEGVDADAAVAAATSVLRGADNASEGLDPTPNVLAGSLVAAGSPAPSPAADLSVWLLAVTLLLLLIACANVANLLLSRQTAREREMATRLALGARRGRLLRQHLTESLLIALAGAALGLLVAFLGTRLVGRFPVPAAASELGMRPLLFALGLAVLVALVSGAAPAVRAARTEFGPSLRERHGAGRRGRRVQRTLIGLQGALALVLLVGTGLFVRSLREVVAIDTGMAFDRLLNVSADLKNAGFSDPEREVFFELARQRVLEIPGVESAAMVHFGPFVGMSYGVPVNLSGADTIAFEQGPLINWVGPDYFATVGARLLQGREFVASDRAGERVAVVNASFDRRMPAGRRALGACLAASDAPGECTRIVGVVADVRRSYMDADVPPTIYLPRDRTPTPISWGGPNLVVRTDGSVTSLAGAVRSAVQDLDPRLPYVAVEPVTDRISGELLPYRLGATMFTLFGVLALAVAVVGIYGVLAHFVAERRPDIGVRRSFGANDSHILRYVLKEGMVPLGIGALAGLALAFLASRMVASLLYGVDARDPVVFFGAALFLMAAAALACWLPARRAVRAEPMAALRAE